MFSSYPLVSVKSLSFARHSPGISRNRSRPLERARATFALKFELIAIFPAVPRCPPVEILVS